MKVLSLFDGMSCGQIALRELGIIPDVYYASEIDTHAINQIQLDIIIHTLSFIKNNSKQESLRQ